MSSTTSTRGTARVGCGRMDPARIGRCNRIADIASAEIVDELWHQPIQKPKTRGSCVVSVDAEVEGYY
jgi:hypothetical protein